MVLEDAEKVIGVVIRDNITGSEYPVYSKSTLLCGGPFTDDIRRLQDPQCQEAVRGASGIHIVLPSYYAPKSFGLVDMNTSGMALTAISITLLQRNFSSK